MIDRTRNRSAYHCTLCRLGLLNMQNVYLSPYVEEPLNSKVIKSFVPELRSRKYFCVSGFLCA